MNLRLHNQAEIREIRKSTDSHEKALIGLNDEVKKVKQNANEIDKKIFQQAEKQFNPFLEDF